MMTTVQLEHQNVFNDFLKRYPRRHNEFSFRTLFPWELVANYQWEQRGEHLFLYSETYDFLFMPIGPEISPAELRQVSDSFRAQGKSGRYILIEPDYIERHPEIHDSFVVSMDRDNFDYLYESELLAELKGRNLDKKRNLIHQFEAVVPNWSSRPFEMKDSSMCLELACTWCRRRNCEGSVALEHRAIARALTHADALGFKGTLLFNGDSLLAFTLWGPHTDDTALIHYEKADSDVKGAAQMINRETAKAIRSMGFRWINREQDLGEDGLRQAKLSYRPSSYVEVCQLTPKV